MGQAPLIGLPKLAISEKICQETCFDPVYAFYYEAEIHKELPHVIKFSGGCSSAMLLFTLLEADLLDAERGDVIIFNNTSAEHPKTYEFVAKCKEYVENRYEIPFFWIEFQTYEDARNGEWTRLPTYRMVNPYHHSETALDGYHSRGEVFEELLSWNGYVPTQFQRTCTANLKLETTRAFLRDWLACKSETEHLGHYSDSSRIDYDDYFERHQRNHGKVPRNIFFEKKEFLLKRPVRRAQQRFADFSSAFKAFGNKHLVGKSYGEKAHFGPEGIEYLAFIGLRYDEMRRVIRVRRRNAPASDNKGYEGEHVYMPLSAMKVTREDVESFWNKQNWGLDLAYDAGLSNCTYCFLKGVKTLKKVFLFLEENLTDNLRNTPCDIQWWMNIEKKYGRDLKAEKRVIRKDVPNNFIGFFGTKSEFSYATLAKCKEKEEIVNKYASNILPCDCTD